MVYVEFDGVFEMNMLWFMFVKFDILCYLVFEGIEVMCVDCLIFYDCSDIDVDWWSVVVECICWFNLGSE